MLQEWHEEPVASQDVVSPIQPGPSANLSSLYNWKPFDCKRMERAELRKRWEIWVRGLNNLLAAAKVTDPSDKKIQLLTLGGLELQEVFYEIPGADVTFEETTDPYEVAVRKLTEFFAPKHHEAFERHLFWQMKPEEDEQIEKFILRVQKRAENCDFGSDSTNAKEKSVLDKIIQCAPNELRNKLFEREKLTLDVAIHMVNTHQSLKYQTRAMASSSTSDLSGVNRVFSTDQQSRDNRVFSTNQRSRDKRVFSADQRSRSYTDDSCVRCGSVYHRGNDKGCPALSRKCKICGGTGHYARRCTSRRQRYFLLR